MNIKLNCPDWTNIKPDDVELELGTDALREEIESWKDVYGVEERYRAKCCGENDGKYWLEQVLGNAKMEEKHLKSF